MTPFCERHTLSFLSQLDLFPQPLDLGLSRYFRIHKSLGSTDRRMMGDLVYGMARWKGLLDWLCPEGSHLDRLRCYRNIDPSKILTRLDIPLSLRLGISPYLYERLNGQFGPEETIRICQILNGNAPVTIRVNLLKTTRDALQQKWEGRFSLSRCEHAEAGLHFEKREPLFSLPEFKEGLFEMQDEGSQLIAKLVAAKPGDAVLDFCSGSGGKSLAIAPAMGGKGQIYLHDVRPHVLLEARKRLKRAGVQNAQWLTPEHSQMKRILGKCDWVLADVPCSGSGTLRRNPDQKWKIDAPSVERLVELQRQIVKEAIRYLKPTGKLVYATCSLLDEENKRQVEWILASFPLKLDVPPFSLLPQEKGSDGFFGAVFSKKI